MYSELIVKIMVLSYGSKIFKFFFRNEFIFYFKEKFYKNIPNKEQKHYV